jgi:hypothetical protein
VRAEVRAKTTIVFWAAVAAAVFLLGGTVASVEALLRHPSFSNVTILLASLAGLAVAGLVTGRIVVVVGRRQRRVRREGG